MRPVFLREQKRYTHEELSKSLKVDKEGTASIVRKLKEYGILKAVKAVDEQKNLSELLETDIEIAGVDTDQNKFYYVFVFVGIVIVDNIIIACYPKYIMSNGQPLEEFMQVLRVIRRFNAKEQIIRVYTEEDDKKTFNPLALMVFLIEDYYDNGLYSNSKDILEINGTGEIAWDKTINEAFTILSDNRPYYTELFTKRRVNDEYDFIKRLHECTLTLISKELGDSGLLDVFGFSQLELSDEDILDFGDNAFICDLLQKELSVQFNTQKQILLKALYSFFAHDGILTDMDTLSVFGTNSFNLVWEKVCGNVFDNKLDIPLSQLIMPKPLANEYLERDEKGIFKYPKLIDVIDKPRWCGISQLGKKYWHNADTLIPDIVTFDYTTDKHVFVILDAKYYNLIMDEGNLRGQPGIESITKQYLYQLAYKSFATIHGFDDTVNCFIIPTESMDVTPERNVSLKMLDDLSLSQIQVRLIPASTIFEAFLSNSTLSIGILSLNL